MYPDSKRALIENWLKELPIFKCLSDIHLSQLAGDFIIQHIKFWHSEELSEKKRGTF